MVFDKLAQDNLEKASGGSKQYLVELTGEVIDALPNEMFNVCLENGHELIACISGKLRMQCIRILPGDKVKVESLLHNLSRGRIVAKIN